MAQAGRDFGDIVIGRDCGCRATHICFKLNVAVDGGETMIEGLRVKGNR